MKTILINSKKIISFILVTMIGMLSLSFIPAQAATASFGVSGSNKINTNQNVTVTISVNGSAAYNAVEASVTFSNLNYVSATAASGWTPVAGPARSGSTVTFSGALLGSTATGSKSVMTLTLKAPASAGTGTVTASGKIALADGSGTQVNASNGTLNITVQFPPTAAPTAVPVPGAPSVSSSTHPDQTKSYGSTDATLAWTKDSGVTDFSYILDTIATTTPDDVSDGADTSKTFSNLQVGKNYFHIKAKNGSGWGATTHFVINVDKSGPEPFSITPQTKDGVTKIYFSTSDSSGTVTYEVFFDGVSKGVLASGVDVPSGTKNVKVVATDSAGNKTESSLVLGAATGTLTPTPITILSQDPNANIQNNVWVQILGILLVLSLAYSGVATYFLVKSSQGMSVPGTKSTNRGAFNDFASPSKSSADDSPLR